MAQERVSITFHLVPGKDNDLIEELQSVSGVARADLIKSRLRGSKEAKTARKEPSVTVPDYSPVLDDLLNRVYELQKNVYHLPETIDQMLARLTAHPSLASIPPIAPPERARASDESLQRRQERTKGKWS